MQAVAGDDHSVPSDSQSQQLVLSSTIAPIAPVSTAESSIVPAPPPAHAESRPRRVGVQVLPGEQCIEGREGAVAMVIPAPGRAKGNTCWAECGCVDGQDVWTLDIGSLPCILVFTCVQLARFVRRAQIKLRDHIEPMVLTC